MWFSCHAVNCYNSTTSTKSGIHIQCNFAGIFTWQSVEVYLAPFSILEVPHAVYGQVDSSQGWCFSLFWQLQTCSQIKWKKKERMIEGGVKVYWNLTFYIIFPAGKIFYYGPYLARGIFFVWIVYICLGVWYLSKLRYRIMGKYSSQFYSSRSQTWRIKRMSIVQKLRVID